MLWEFLGEFFGRIVRINNLHESTFQMESGPNGSLGGKVGQGLYKIIKMALLALKLSRQMAVAEIKITVQEFHRLQFKGEDAYIELINGVVVRKASPSPKHQEISQNLNFALSMFVRSRNSGKIFAAPTDVFLDDYNHLIPDLCFISGGRLDIIDYREGIFGAPDLVVEIISQGSVVQDRVDKRAAYQCCGVREYWLVDSENQSIEVFQNRNGKFHILSHALGSGTVGSFILDGFEVDVAEVMG